MIFGDPHQFAILIEKVPEWTVPGSYENGLFHYIIDGQLFPDNANVSTLGGDIGCLSKDNALINPPEDTHLFNLPRQQAFAAMLNSMFPEILNPGIEVSDDFVTDYKYMASTYNLEDRHCYIVAVSSGPKIRIMGAKTSFQVGNKVEGYAWKDCETLNIYEAFLSKKAVLKIIKEVKSKVEISRDYS